MGVDRSTLLVLLQHCLPWLVDRQVLRTDLLLDDNLSDVAFRVTVNAVGPQPIHADAFLAHVQQGIATNQQVLQCLEDCLPCLQLIQSAQDVLLHLGQHRVQLAKQRLPLWMPLRCT